MKKKTRLLKIEKNEIDNDLKEMNSSIDMDSNRKTDQIRSGMVCFICCRKLLKPKTKAAEHEPDRVKTEEHILPSWLLKEFGLDKPGPESYIIMRHGRKIRLPILIPCCVRCNSVMNSLIEMPVQFSLKNGNLESISKTGAPMYAWIMKIMLGMAYTRRSYRLQFDQRIKPIIGLSDQTWASMNFYRRHLEEICKTETIKNNSISNSIICIEEAEGPKFGIQYDESLHILLIKYNKIIIWADFGIENSAQIARSALSSKDINTRIKAQQSMNYTLPIKQTEKDSAKRKLRGIPTIKNKKQSWRPYRTLLNGKHLIITSGIKGKDSIILEGYMINNSTLQLIGEENAVYFEIEKQSDKTVIINEIHRNHQGNIDYRSSARYITYSLELSEESNSDSVEMFGIIQLILGERKIKLDIVPEILKELELESKLHFHFWTNRMIKEDGIESYNKSIINN